MDLLCCTYLRLLNYSLSCEIVSPEEIQTEGRLRRAREKLVV